MTGNAPAITSARGAEEFAAAWLRHIGEQKVRLTPAAGDGGIDVISARFAVQVKRYAKGSQIGRPDIQRLVGATPSDLAPVFLSSVAYSAAAQAYAKERGVYLFRFRHAGGKWPTAVARSLPSGPRRTIPAPTTKDADWLIAKTVKRRVRGAADLDPTVILRIIREVRRVEQR